jgi:hypothetical protein
MELVNFGFEDRYLIFEDQKFDLHNDFVLDELSYHVTDAELTLTWQNERYGFIEAVSLEAFRLHFSGIYMIRVVGRDIGGNPRDDAAVGLIGFMWDASEEFEGVAVTESREMVQSPMDGASHLSIVLETDLTVKIGAQQAMCELVPPDGHDPPWSVTEA